MCQQLRDAWSELNEQAAERARKLELSLKAQQFFFEAGEVESWLTERNDVLSSTDYGRDRDAATKLLTKHKVGFSVYSMQLLKIPSLFANKIFNPTDS